MGKKVRVIEMEENYPKFILVTIIYH